MFGFLWQKLGAVVAFSAGGILAALGALLLPDAGSRGTDKRSTIPRQLPPRTTAVQFPPEENLHLAADGRHADAIPAVRDARDDAREQAAVVRNDG